MRFYVCQKQAVWAYREQNSTLNSYLVRRVGFSIVQVYLLMVRFYLQLRFDS